MDSGLIMANILCKWFGLFCPKPSPLPPSPPPAPPSPPLKPVAIIVTDEFNRPVEGAQVRLDGNPNVFQLTNKDGYTLDPVCPAELAATHLFITKEGYEDFSEHRDLPPDGGNIFATVKSKGFNPDTVPVEKLARIRGAMWSARYPMPWGPRPNDPSNILALSAIACYSSPEDRKKMLKAYAAMGYTHGVIGAWRPGPYSPYHELYPDVDISFDSYLDILQEFWDCGVIPVVFLKPDNWDSGQLEGLTQFYSQPRAQKLVKVCVPGGWEPSKDTSNAEWVRWVQWGARVLPNALRAIHMEADFDAPGNNDDFTPGNPKYIGFAESWVRVAPYLHFYFIQNGGYVFGPSEVPTEEFKKNFTDQFRVNPAPGRGSISDRFVWGYAGWPTHSAWGDRGITPIASEFAAYADFWKNWDEKYAKQLGDLAIESGAGGSLDGCSVR
jgi:hypothetical protein